MYTLVLIISMVSTDAYVSRPLEGVSSQIMPGKYATEESCKQAGSVAVNGTQKPARISYTCVPYEGSTK